MWVGIGVGLVTTGVSFLPRNHVRPGSAGVSTEGRGQGLTRKGGSAGQVFLLEKQFATVSSAGTREACAPSQWEALGLVFCGNLWLWHHCAGTPGPKLRGVAGNVFPSRGAYGWQLCLLPLCFARFGEVFSNTV